MDKKVILIGAGAGIEHKAAIEALKAQGKEVVILTPEEAYEQGLDYRPDPPEIDFGLINNQLNELWQAPETRKERRKRERQQRKKR